MYDVEKEKRLMVECDRITCFNRPSLTSLTLTSFTSLRDPECAHARETRGEKAAHTAHREEELSQEPPSYDDLLK